MSAPHETRAEAKAHAADDKAKAAEAATEPVDPKEDELVRLRCACAALGTVVKNLGGNPDAVVKAATEHLKPVVKKHTGPMKKATVTPVVGAGGVTGEPCEVEYPADAPDAETAAIEAYKEKAGVWSLPAQPVVELEGGPKKKKEKA